MTPPKSSKIPKLNFTPNSLSPRVRVPAPMPSTPKVPTLRNKIKPPCCGTPSHLPKFSHSKPSPTEIKSEIEVLHPPKSAVAENKSVNSFNQTMKPCSNSTVQMVSEEMQKEESESKVSRQGNEMDTQPAAVSLVQADTSKSDTNASEKSYYEISEVKTLPEFSEIETQTSVLMVPAGKCNMDISEPSYEISEFHTSKEHNEVETQTSVQCVQNEASKCNTVASQQPCEVHIDLETNANGEIAEGTGIDIMGGGDYDEVYDTDYSVYQDDEEDPDYEEKIKEVKINPETSYVEPPMMTPNYDNVSVPSSNRKTKTIFSVDLPLSRTHVESGPGENGDGFEVLLPRKKISTISNMCSSKSRIEYLQQSDMQLHSRGNSEVINQQVISASVSMTAGSSTKPGSEKCPELRALNGTIEILSDVESTSIMSRRSSSMKSEQKFNLILQRSSAEFSKKKKFTKSIEILNSTESLHGFKISCKSAPNSHMKIRPTIGLVRPNEKISIQVDIKKPTSFGMNYDLTDAGDRTDVKIFRSYCSDLNELPEYYETLEDQRPELISSQSVDRIILWDAGDIAGRWDFFNSIRDDEERRLLKEELHSSQLGQYPSATTAPESYSTSVLVAVKNQLAVTDRNIRETLKELVRIKNAQNMVFVLLFLYFSFSTLFPYLLHLGDSRVKEMEPPKNDVCYWCTFMKMLGKFHTHY